MATNLAAKGCIPWIHVCRPATPCSVASSFMTNTLPRQGHCPPAFCLPGKRQARLYRPTKPGCRQSEESTPSTSQASAPAPLPEKLPRVHYETRIFSTGALPSAGSLSSACAIRIEKPPRSRSNIKFLTTSVPALYCVLSQTGPAPSSQSRCPSCRTS